MIKKKLNSEMHICHTREIFGKGIQYLYKELILILNPIALRKAKTLCYGVLAFLRAIGLKCQIRS